jgi:hypothetical protein
MPNTTALPAIAAELPADASADAPIMAIVEQLADAARRLDTLILNQLSPAEIAYRAREIPSEPERYDLPMSPEQEEARERFRAAAAAYWALAAVSWPGRGAQSPGKAILAAPDAILGVQDRARRSAAGRLPHPRGN